MPPGDLKRDRLSTAAFVVGLVSAVTAVVYFVAIPVGIAGLLISVVALRRGRDRRMALGGVLLSLVGLTVALAVVAFLLAANDDHDVEKSLIDGIESGTANDEHPPQHDVQPGMRCQSEIEVLRASGSVLNHTEQVASYQLVVVWESEGRVLGESTSLIDDVAAGASSAWEVTAAGRGDTATTCRVLRIDRTHP